MELQEIRNKKSVLEQKIATLVNDFYLETNTKVRRVEIVTLFNTDKTRVSKTQIQLEEI